jgi:hypothetical protein
MKNNINESEKKADLGAEGSDIWKEILSESVTKKDNEEANIFVFGDKSTGKKSLIRLMNKECSYNEGESKKILNIEEEASKYGLINYSHLSIKKNDDDSDIVNKVGVWVMNELVDEDTFLSLIKPKDMLKCICLIVVDYSRPWTIKASLEKWADFIFKAFGKLIIKFPFEFQKEIRKKSKKK